eukprot:3858475-Heterocapsa_arctica.AAC.1
MEVTLDIRQEQRRQEVLRGKPQVFKWIRQEVRSRLTQVTVTHSSKENNRKGNDMPGDNKLTKELQGLK